jgi:hypothetical protein
VVHRCKARHSALEVEQLLCRQRSCRFAVSRPAPVKVQQYLDLVEYNEKTGRITLLTASKLGKIGDSFKLTFKNEAY